MKHFQKYRRVYLIYLLLIGFWLMATLLMAWLAIRQEHNRVLSPACQIGEGCIEHTDLKGAMVFFPALVIVSYPLSWALYAFTRRRTQRRV